MHQSAVWTADISCMEASRLAGDEAPGFFSGLAGKGLEFVYVHPILSTVLGTVVGMTVVFALRKALWSTGRFIVWDVPTGILKVVTSPLVALYRRVRGRKGHGGASFRLPFIGQVAFIGPCRSCGTKREYTVRATGVYGGAVRGIDTMNGASVIGCPDCTRC